jgi:lipopolysaccharide export system protein LptA
MTCTGAVSIVDAATRQRATGERAVYDGLRQRVEIWGNPVTLIDGQQNQLVGKYLDYDLKSGRAKLQSKSPG